MKTRHMLWINTFLLVIVIMISFVSKSLGTPLVASASTNENSNPYANYSGNKYFLPIIQISYPIFISPGTYIINSCVESSVYAASDGTYIGKLTECVPRIEVRLDGYMQFYYTWTLDFADDSYRITKYDDANNQNMYITDNINNHYDHIKVGGAAAETVTVYDNEPVEGWFLFKPAKQGATAFVFHDDDQGVSIKNIILVP